MRSRHITVSIDLDGVRAAAERIRRETGVALIAVIKADAYGLGATRVADALAGIADELAYFSIHEAREVGRAGIVLGPAEGDPAHYRELNLRPAISNARDARLFAGMPAAINVETGMQRFGCAPDDFDELRRISGADEAFTHAVDAHGAERLREVCGERVSRLHAAASSLLQTPEAWLDAVRPGVALYRGSVRVSARLTAVRSTHGPVGYTAFEHSPVGIIQAGYSNQLRPGPVMINGRCQRLLEVGMNTSFVSVDGKDHPGDEVVLLGDGLTEAELASGLATREHEILCRYTSMGTRVYLPVAARATSRAPDTTRSIAAIPRQT